MIIPCEVAVKSVVPAVKALIAKELVESRRLRQGEVAEILGISQSAVSKYTRKVRGYVVELDDLDEVHTLVETMLGLLESETAQRGDFLSLFCHMCMAVRKTGAMCQLCRKSDPTIETEKCSFCRTRDSPRIRR